MKTVSSLLLAGALALLSVPASAESVHIGNGGEHRIDAHGVCRVIKNWTGAGLHVPFRHGEEWGHGWAAFVNNGHIMPGVEIHNCPPACSTRSEGPRFDGNNYHRELFWDQYWTWVWDGHTIYHGRDIDHRPNSGGWNYDMDWDWYVYYDDNHSRYAIWRWQYC